MTLRFAKKYPKNVPRGLWAEVLPGWYGLVDRTIEKMIAVDPNVRIVEIKEKFSGLNLQHAFDRTNESLAEALDDVATDAFFESKTVCEYTGEPGSLYRLGGWLKTLSPAKAAELGATSKTHTTAKDGHDSTGALPAVR